MYHSDLHDKQLDLVKGAAKIQRGPLHLAGGATGGVNQNIYLRGDKQPINHSSTVQSLQ